MKYLSACLILLLPSCGMFGSSNTIAIPTSELSIVAGWIENNASGFDYDNDGYLTDNEFATFSAWLANEILNRWPAFLAEPPITEEKKREAEINEAKAKGKPIPAKEETK